LDEAPAPRAHVDRHRSAQSAVLVACPSPVDADAQDYQALRAYLQPVLRPGFPGDLKSCPRYVSDLKALSLNRPVWLFEGAPTPHVSGFPLPPSPDERCVPIVWADEPIDADSPTCFLSVDVGFDESLHVELVEAIVNAWRLTGQLAGFRNAPDCHLHSVSGVSWDTYEDERVLAWQFDVGTCSIEDVVRRLAAALRVLEATLGRGSLFRQILVA
jgi:hypothetical protein